MQRERYAYLPSSKAGAGRSEVIGGSPLAERRRLVAQADAERRRPGGCLGDVLVAVESRTDVRGDAHGTAGEDAGVPLIWPVTHPPAVRKY
jgi:hypothetical protein